MAEGVASQIGERMHQIDQQVLSVLRNESEDKLHWTEGTTAPSIAFHVWHIARYSDRNQAMLANISGGSGTEIWESQGIADRWGLDTSKLGGVQTGMGMSDTDSANLTLPERADLLAYTEWTIRLLEEQIARLDDQSLSTDVSAPSGSSTTVGAALLSHLTHASRHLGMIEALRGVQGERGTASA